MSKDETRHRLAVLAPVDQAEPRATVTVVGTGIVGTSLALALTRAGVQVRLADREPAVAALAVAAGAGALRSAEAGPSDVVVVAVPPLATARVVAAEQQAGTGRVYTDVASVKRRVVEDARALDVDMSTFVPGHPMAGGHSSGPRGARADMFAGRPWVITPERDTDPVAVEMVSSIIGYVGARPQVMSAHRHDRAVATASHVPHLVAAGLASLFAREPEPDALSLCGRGIDDTTRIAAGDVALWNEIVSVNADEIEGPLRVVATRLMAVADTIRAGRHPSTEFPIPLLLQWGAHGRARLTSRESARERISGLATAA